MKIPLLAALLVTGASIGGCAASAAPPAAATQPAGQSVPALQAEVQRLSAQQRLAAEENKELRLREEQLTARLRQSEFLSDQQAKQLQVVGDAPRQRDMYKARVDILEQETKDLKRQLKEVTAVLDLLQRTTNLLPASQATTKSSQ